MATNRRIQTTELDFDGIKSSLKSYLQGQQQFSDYDFEGSGLSVLLDILAYNTHYNALYTNLAINEAFLDSAAKRSSVVSKARELGYTPKSSKAATAVVNILMLNDQINAPSFIEIPAYNTFNTLVNGENYNFYNIAAATAIRSGNQYIFQNVELKEGTAFSQNYTYTPGLKIVISNTKVDYDTLTVAVQDNAQTTAIEVYSESKTILNLTPSSPVYFMRELDDQTCEVEFGDGVIGKAPSPGNVVSLQYIAVNEDGPNGANSFTYSGQLPSDTSVYVMTVSTAVGGSGPEDIESIRWNAPKAFTAQNRCVTVDDYRSTILSLYAPARSVAVWGGEDNVPVQYGKVFISIVPQSADLLSVDEKAYVLAEIINPRKTLSITPVIVDPQYLHIKLNVTFYYNPQNTTRNATDIRALVYQTIQDYDATFLEEFNGMFKFSNLTTLIDTCEPAITSNIITLKIHRTIVPVYNIVNEYKLNIGNPIYDSGVPEESILSTGFIPADIDRTCYIEDIPRNDGTGYGDLRMFYYATDNVKITVTTVGTVDYTAGIIDIAGLNITSLESELFELIIKPQSNDVVGTRNEFVTIDLDDIIINAVVDQPSKAYKFTSSRN